MKISKLEEVPLRTIWAREDTDFSQWLSKDENIDQLGSALGVQLEDVKTEYSVGDFKADIICKDAQDGSMVLIENQLEPTDHSHLGQIITYASGLEAKIMIWIVKEARKEHMSAIEWLNNHTSNELNFFLIQIKAFKIGNSHPAPKFEIMIQPNEWYKDVQTKTKTDISPFYQARQQYFSEFVSYANQIDKAVQLPSIPTYLRSYYAVKLDSPKAYMRIYQGRYRGNDIIRVGLTIRDFDVARKILENKEEVENLLDCDDAHWNESMLETHQSIWFSFDKHSDMMSKEAQFQWLYDNHLVLKEVFNKYSKLIN